MLLLGKTHSSVMIRHFFGCVASLGFFSITGLVLLVKKTSGSTLSISTAEASKSKVAPCVGYLMF